MKHIGTQCGITGGGTAVHELTNLMRLSVHKVFTKVPAPAE
jgi:hypothetical protein